MNGTSPYAMSNNSNGLSRQRSGQGSHAKAPNGQRPPLSTPFMSLAGVASRESLSTDASTSYPSLPLHAIGRTVSGASANNNTSTSNRNSASECRPKPGATASPRTPFTAVDKGATPKKKSRRATGRKKRSSQQASLEASPTPASLSHSRPYFSMHKATNSGGADVVSSSGHPNSLALRRDGDTSQKQSTSSLPLCRADTSTDVPLHASQNSPLLNGKRFMTIYTKSSSPDRCTGAKNSNGATPLRLSLSHTLSSSNRSEGGVASAARAQRPPSSSPPSSKSRVATSSGATPSTAATVFTRSATTMGGTGDGVRRADVPKTKGGTYLDQWRAKQAPSRQGSLSQSGTNVNSKASGGPARRSSASSSSTPGLDASTKAAASRGKDGPPRSAFPARAPTPENAPRKRRNTKDVVLDEEDLVDTLADSSVTSLSSSTALTNKGTDQSQGEADRERPPSKSGQSGVSLTATPMLPRRRSPGFDNRVPAPRADTKPGSMGRGYNCESPIDHALIEELLPGQSAATRSAVKPPDNPLDSPSSSPALAVSPSASSPPPPPPLGFQRLGAMKSNESNNSHTTASSSVPGQSNLSRIPPRQRRSSSKTGEGSSLRRSQRLTSQASAVSSTRLSSSQTATPYLEDLEDFIQQQSSKLRHATGSSSSDASRVRHLRSPPSSASAAAQILADAGVDLAPAKTRAPQGQRSGSDSRTTSGRRTQPTSLQSTSPPPAPVASSASVSASSFARQGSQNQALLKDVLNRREQRLQRQASMKAELSTPAVGHRTDAHTNATSQNGSPRPREDTATTAAAAAAPFERQPSALELYRMRRASLGTPALSPSPHVSKTPVPQPSQDSSHSQLPLPKAVSVPSPTKPKLSRPQSRRLSLASLSSSSTFASTALTGANLSTSTNTTATTIGKEAAPHTIATPSPTAAFTRHTAVPASSTTTAPHMTPFARTGSPLKAPTAVSGAKPPTVPTAAVSASHLEQRLPSAVHVDALEKEALLRAAAAVVGSRKPSVPTTPPLYTEVPGLDEEDDEEDVYDEEAYDGSMHSAQSHRDWDEDMPGSPYGHHDQTLSADAFASVQPVPSVVPKLNFARLPSANNSFASQPAAAAVAAPQPAKHQTGTTSHSLKSSFAAQSGTSLTTLTDVAARPTTVASTTSQPRASPPLPLAQTLSRVITPPPAPTSVADGTSLTGSFASSSVRVPLTSIAPTAIDDLEQSVTAMLSHYTHKSSAAVSGRSAGGGVGGGGTASATTSPPLSTSPEKPYEALMMADMSMPSVVSAVAAGAGNGPAPPTGAHVTAVPCLGTTTQAGRRTSCRSQELKQKVDALLGKPSAASFSFSTGAVPLVRVDAVSLAALTQKRTKPKSTASAAAAAKMADINRRLAGSKKNEKAGLASDEDDVDDDEEDAPVDPCAQWCDPDETDVHARHYFLPTRVPDSVPPLDLSRLFLENEKDAFDKYRVTLPSAVADPLQNYAALLSQIGPLLPTPDEVALAAADDACTAGEDVDELAATAVSSAEAKQSAMRRGSRSLSSITGSPMLGRSANGGGLEDVQFVPVVSHESSTERLLRSVQELNSREQVLSEENDEDEDGLENTAKGANGAAAGRGKQGGPSALRVNRKLHLTDESDALDGGRGREREEKVLEHKRGVDRLLFGYQEQRARKVLLTDASNAFADILEACRLALKPS